MLESYTVGAIFTVKDESAATLTAIEQRILAIDKAATAAAATLREVAAVRFTGASNSLAGLEKRMAGITQRAGAFSSAVVESMEGVNASILTATESARAMAAAFAEAAGAARAIGRANLEGGAEGTGRARAGSMWGGLWGGRAHINAAGKAGPLHGRVPVGLGLGAAAAGLYGAYEEAKVEDVATRVILTAGRPTGGDVTKTDDFKRIRGMIQTGQSLGFKSDDVGDAVLTGVRMLNETALKANKPMSFDQSLGLIDTLLPLAAQESRMKPGSNIEEALKALVQLPHMAGRFESGQVAELARQYTFASTRTDVPLPQFTRALSYSMPVGVSELGMDPGTIMLMTAGMQRAGITNTKSGTWLREFFLRSLPTAGTITSHTQKQHDEALAQLGLVKGGQSAFLVDKAGKPTKFVKGQEQNIDWTSSEIRESQLLIDAKNKMRPDIYATLLRKAFGTQGAGVAGLDSVEAFAAQLPIMQTDMGKFKGGLDFLTDLQQNSPIQQGRQAIGDFKNVLMDIGTDVLPPVTAALRAFDNVLKGILGTLPGDRSGKQVAGDMTKNAGLGGAAGFMVGGPPGAVVGATTAAVATLTAEARKSPAIMNALNVMPDVDEFGMPLPSSFKEITPLTASKGPGANTPQSGTAGGGTSVHIDSVVIQSPSGDPQHHADAFVDLITKKLSHSDAHNLGPGEGSWSSPFTAGGGP